MFFNKYNGLILFFTFCITHVAAHEMWIEPVNFIVQLEEKIYAHEKVGQNFKGNEYSYLSSSYESFNLTVNGKTRPIKSRIGDIPAVSELATEEGLTILSAVTTPSYLKYKKWKKFESFINNEGLDWVLAKHKKRGLPDKNFKESYRRFPKSLVKVGHGKGDDEALGLPLEWIVETNPYTSSEGNIKARLLWNGKAFPNAHVNVFNKVDNKMLKTELTTDEDGRVEIPRANGGDFLINAVQMIEPLNDIAKEKEAVWESLWASMTYQLKTMK